MTAPARGRIVTMGGGGFLMEPDNPRLDDYVLGLAGVDRPRVLFVPTASGDSPSMIERFHLELGDRAECAILSLFQRDDGDLRDEVMAAQVVYVGGGNTANLIAIWRLHGLDVILREAAASGVILAGVSAGALCWFESGITDSFGPRLARLGDGLGFLPGAFAPHYDGDPGRRPMLRRMVGSGELPDAWAADDYCALSFEDGALVEIVASRPGARAYRVTRDGEVAHDARLLP